MSGGKRDEQAEERRAQLIDTALALFAERGFEATRIRDIASRAQVAQGLLYHYFPSKEALLAAIIARYGPLQMLGELLTAPHDQPARETLLALGQRAYALAQERRAILQVFLREILWRPETRGLVMAMREQALGLLAGYLQARVAAGELRPHDSYVAGQTFVSAVLVAALAGLPADPYITGAVDVVLAGIAAQPGNAAPPHSTTTSAGG